MKSYTLLKWAGDNVQRQKDAIKILLDNVPKEEKAELEALLKELN